MQESKDRGQRRGRSGQDLSSVSQFFGRFGKKALGGLKWSLRALSRQIAVFVIAFVTVLVLVTLVLPWQTKRTVEQLTRLDQQWDVGQNATMSVRDQPPSRFNEANRVTLPETIPPTVLEKRVLELPQEQRVEDEPVVRAAAATVWQSTDMAQWPVLGRVYNTYGWHRNPDSFDWQFQPGISIAPDTQEVVRPVLSGSVQEVNEDTVRGLVVTIRHHDGWESVYGNLARVFVSEGDRVDPTTVMAHLHVGSQGVMSPLYLELKKDGLYRDPTEVLP